MKQSNLKGMEITSQQSDVQDMEKHKRCKRKALGGQGKD